jgi:hypothetical protein
MTEESSLFCSKVAVLKGEDQEINYLRDSADTCGRWYEVVFPRLSFTILGQGRSCPTTTL